MDDRQRTTARKLMEAFMRFRRLKGWRHVEAHLGLRHSALMVLYCIKRRTPPGTPGIKVSEISSTMQVTPPTVTQILNGLADGGYIQRDTDERDRRAVRVRVTPKGEQVLRQMTTSLLESFQGLVEYLGEAKSEELAGLLSEVFTYFSDQRNGARR